MRHVARFENRGGRAGVGAPDAARPDAHAFPQGGVSDRRVEGFSLNRLPASMAGDLDELVSRLTMPLQTDQPRAPAVTTA